jgi:hypothetical protein
MTDFQAMLLFFFGLGVLATSGIVASNYIQAKALNNLTDLLKELPKNE